MVCLTGLVTGFYSGSAAVLAIMVALDAEALDEGRPAVGSTTGEDNIAAVCNANGTESVPECRPHLSSMNRRITSSIEAVRLAIPEDRSREICDLVSCNTISHCTAPPCHGRYYFQVDCDKAL
jgi:hypothetical protein